MAKILKGSLVAESINEQIKEDVKLLKVQGIIPSLGILRIGDSEDDIAYERGATKRCEKTGVHVQKFILPENVSEHRVLKQIDELNRNPEIHGVLMFRPLPKHLDEHRICQELSPQKDVDGITTDSAAGVFSGQKIGFPPCTPKACMEILDYYDISCTGKNAVVLGRSMVVGKPAALMLLQKNATVTICHTKTKNVEEVCRKADILIAAAGRSKIVGRESCAAGQIVIDVGINVDESGTLCGDVDFEEVENLVHAITPVPGGVGSVTTSILVRHVVDAAKNTLTK